MLTLKSKTARFGIAAVVIAGFLFYEFGIKASRQRSQVYEGIIVEVYRDRDVTRGVKRPHKPEYRYYTHYWKIETEGETIDIEVPHSRWNRAEVGNPVKKIEGERYPMLATDEATDRRETLDAVDLFGGG